MRIAHARMASIKNSLVDFGFIALYTCRTAALDVCAAKLTKIQTTVLHLGYFSKIMIFR